MSSMNVAAALHIKETIRRHETSNTMPMREWFQKPVSGNINIVPYSAMTTNADNELNEWYTLPTDYVDYKCDFEDNFVKWIDEISVEALAGYIEPVIDGGKNLYFSPWQRLFIAFICNRSISCTSSAIVTADHIEAAQQPSGNERRRKIPIRSTFSLRANACAEFNILKLATASGKTSISLTIAFTLASEKFDQTTISFQESRTLRVFEGDVECIPAKLILVASSGGVHNHWINEYNRLKDAFMAKAPSLPHHVWDGQSRDHSVEIAKNLDGVVFWFLQMSKLNEEMRKYPDIPILCVITDEMSPESPREKTATSQSPVVCRLLPQATPDALCRATRGYTSWLRRALDGELIAPNRLKRELRFGCYKEAQLLLSQRCKLDLIMPSIFREQIRMDLAFLIPAGAEIVHIESRRATLASSILGEVADVVPASYKALIMRKIPIYSLARGDNTPNQIETMLNAPNASIRTLLTLLKSLKMESGELVVDRNNDYRRAVEHTEEFCNECPICKEEDLDDICMFNCCSYCVCSSCRQGLQRCPFCRSSIQENIEPEEPHILTLSQMGPTLEATLGMNTTVSNMQMGNLVYSLLALQAHGYKRIIMMVNFYHNLSYSEQFVRDLKSYTGIHRILFTDELTKGKGTRFVGVKRDFDDTERVTEPIVLLCNNHESSGVLVGVNFDKADSVVLVGEINATIGTQLMGRVFRPNTVRDNDKMIPFVKIFSSTRN